MTVRAASIVTTRPASVMGALVAGSNTGPAIYPPARLQAHRSGIGVVGVVEAGVGCLMQFGHAALVRFGDSCVTQARRCDRSHPISDLSSGLSKPQVLPAAYGPQLGPHVRRSVAHSPIQLGPLPAEAESRP